MNINKNTHIVIWIIIGVSLTIHGASLLLSNTLLNNITWPLIEAHAVVETFGSAVALFIALALLFFEKYNTGTSFNIEIATALLVMGILDGFHAAVNVGQTFVWLHSIATFFGGLTFITLLAHSRFTWFKNRYWLISACTAAIIIGTMSLAYPTDLPHMVEQGHFTGTAMALNAIGGTMFFVAAVKILLVYRDSHNVSDLLFCLHCFLFGAAAIMFEQSKLWDTAWWGWHILRLMAYIVALGFLLVEGMQILQELKQHKEQLEELVSERTRSLVETNQKLEETVAYLNRTHTQLLEREKMASLGDLVAGVAHEINTPIGIGITSTTYLQQHLDDLTMKYQTKVLSTGVLEDFISDSTGACKLLLKNLQRTANLINSFKQVAVDQSCEQVRAFNVHDYVQEIIAALNPEIKKHDHKIKFHCDPGLIATTYPGVIFQIISNLVANSIAHGFKESEQGEITIEFFKHDEHIELIYKDNGKGMSELELSKLFEPFYTTKRGSGGMGLGAYIIYNLVTQGLDGDVHTVSEPGKGLEYRIAFANKQATPLKVVS
ncbi:sensor histidine kinase [Pseudoalteromonas sp. B530]|uniref:sensor histidine kinase n=1 Tax=Pseudoalteromonas sp. B530 TaxID=2994390 RepID=UPI00224AD150|nr:HAMP domain-containing sensor histidine kinase [Pseudoalteromonas sp. B530]MCX2768999.1 HAMP domain-containing sensor histidine kinase [Pseudoalteromonas sp. B530]